MRVEKDLIAKIKKTRIEKQLKQKEFSEILGISPVRYCRFENGTVKDFDEILLKKIINYLDIDYSFPEQEQDLFTKQMSLRMPVVLYERLQWFQVIKGYDNMSQTIIGLLTDYTTNTTLMTYKDEIKDFMEELLLSTFVKEMKELKLSKSKYKHLIEYLSDEYNFDPELEQEKLELIDRKILRANK